MKAIILKGFGGVDNFELTEVEQPTFNDNEVLIKIRATAFNPVDYQIRQGSSESKLLKSPILGMELSGEIVGIGKNVHSFHIGDKVSACVVNMTSNGTYTEYISVPSELIVKNPSQLSFEQAAAIPLVGMTALQCFKRIFIPKDKAIFISGGAGGVGTVLIKLLLANGNTNIFTTAGNAESINHLKSIGINEHKIIDYKKENVVTALQRKNNNKQFEYVIDLVGGQMSESCAALIGVFGSYIDVTFLSTEKARIMLFEKAVTIVNVACYAPALNKGKDKYEYYRNGLGELFDKVEHNIISPTEINVVGKLSVDTVQKAHLLMENNQTQGKKLVMSIS